MEGRESTHSVQATLARMKREAGSHSPSIATIQQELPEVAINIDACFLSNPYATDLFLDYFTQDLVGAGKLRRAIEYYPSQNMTMARRVAQRLGVAPACVFVGNGATEIIQAILHNFCEHTLLINLPTFSPYYEFARPDTRVIYHQLSKEQHFQLDVDAYLALVRREKPDTVVIINPNNPDGGYVPLADVRALLSAMRDVKNVILDESFVHFAFEDDQLRLISFSALMHEFSNVIVVKSMSKDFGIAGIRAGYAIMAEDKVRHLLSNGFLWNSSGLAEYFFELLTRDEFMQQYDQVRTRYIREAQAFFHELSQINGMQVYPTKANFALIELANGVSAFDFVSHLLIRHGIYTRGCGDKKGLMGEFVRIAARTAVENQHILRGVQDIMSMNPDLARVGSEDDARGDETNTQAQGSAVPRKLLSRAEVLRGLAGRTTKQASTLLVLIENQTAHLVAQSQQVLDELLTAATPRAPGRAFFAALMLGREPSDPVTIEDLERYAPEWASLVPDSSNVRATVAHLLGKKYSFTHPAVPRLRAALGLDTTAVQDAYQLLYTAPIATIFARDVAPATIQSRSAASTNGRGAAEMLGLRVVPVNMLFPHEYHDPQRVDHLAARLSAAGMLANPPLVVAMPDGDRYMVLDGATRTAAFQQLGYPHIVVQLVDPQQDNVHLNTWFHVVRGESAPALLTQAHAVAGLRLSERPIDQLTHDLWNHGALGYLVTAEREGFLLEHTENPPGADWLDVLTELVERYGRWGTVERTLVDDVNALASQYADLAGLVVFPQFTLDVVLQLVAKGRLLPAGITRFLVSGRILRLNVPLAMLTNQELIVQKQAWLDKLVQTKLAQRAVRHYQEPVILLDE